MNMKNLLNEIENMGKQAYEDTEYERATGRPNSSIFWIRQGQMKALSAITRLIKLNK